MANCNHKLVSMLLLLFHFFPIFMFFIDKKITAYSVDQPSLA